MSDANDLVTKVRGLLGPGPRTSAHFGISGWSYRESQAEMAEAISRRILDGGVLVVEAPTGVGKTLAYLLPSILCGRKTIVTTHTKTLQDQVVDKDLPRAATLVAGLGVRLERASLGESAARDDRTGQLRKVTSERGGVVRFAVMKGRSNYACIDRLDRRLGQRSFAFGALSDAGLDDERRDFEAIAAWAPTTHRGDRAEIPSLGERSTAWDQIDARVEICTGARCPRFDECYVVRMRKEAEDADLVIVNHHLLFADLALRAAQSLSGSARSAGEVVPSAEVLIVDEAHAVEEIASEYFGGRVSKRQVEHLGRDLLAFSRGMTGTEGLTQDLSRAIILSDEVFDVLPAREGRSALSALSVRMEERAERGEGERGERKDRRDRNNRKGGKASKERGERGERTEGDEKDERKERDEWEMREEMREPAWVARARALALDAHRALMRVAEELERSDVSVPEAELLCRRAREIGQSLRFVVEADDPGYAYWAERQGRNAALGASPIVVSDLLLRFMFPRFETTILTSATLSTGDDACSYFRGAIGAPSDAEARVLSSPFDFAEQAALYLPRGCLHPDAPDALDGLVEVGRSLIDLTLGGALFLFTSRRVMRAVHERLAPRLAFPVLVQGDRPKRVLLREFVDRAPSVLFATASFWEGVDIPGDPLRLVLIDRLPFDAPSDPVLRARTERFESSGGSGFANYQLPRAILRLRQGFGRLIRSSVDRGIVAILDPRLRTRGYGKVILRALPRARVFDDYEALASWWQRTASRGAIPP